MCDGKDDCGDIYDEYEIVCYYAREFGTLIIQDCLDCTEVVFHIFIFSSACYRPWSDCDNGRCIYPYEKCDGYDQCGDNTDEKYCTNIMYSYI